MKIKILAVVLSIAFTLANCEDNEYFNLYKGYSVYQVVPKTSLELSFLEEIQELGSGRVDFWTDIRGLNIPVNIMVEPSSQNFIELAFTGSGLTFTKVIEDVSSLMKLQRTGLGSNEKLGDFDYAKYHTLSEIHQWIDDLANQYPKYVQVFNVTRSYEGREVKAFKISVPSAKSDPKPAMWFDGGIHAREWISPATVIYISYSLLSKYGNDTTVTEILNTFDFYILPVFNVDGYAYTFEKDRMWRKTRSKNKLVPCVGTDPNRNWDMHWAEGGASADPCSDSYHGPKAFSEIEVKGVSDFIFNNKDHIVCYINFHSYSQLWMSPWGYENNKPANFTIQDNGSIAAVKALSSLYGTQYEHGNIAQTIYVASGNSVDWTYGVAGILFSYAVELRDQGQYGFLLPENQIIPSGLETFEAIKALALYIKQNM